MRRWQIGRRLAPQAMAGLALVCATVLNGGLPGAAPPPRAPSMETAAGPAPARPGVRREHTGPMAQLRDDDTPPAAAENERGDRPEKENGPQKEKEKEKEKEKGGSGKESTGKDGAETAAPAAPAVVSAPPAEARPAPTTPEGIYMARLDELITPVRDWMPPPEDVQRLRDAHKLAASDPAAARAARAQIKDPAVRKLADWMAFRAGAGEAAEIAAFVAANPAWPDRVLLLRRAEEQLLGSGGDAQRIKAFFRNQEPRTGAGMAALASALLAEGKEAEAKALAIRAWRDFELPASFEAGFLERFGAFLSEADHKRRLDRILVDEVRFRAERNDRAAIARRMLPLLPEAERRKAEARIAVFVRAKLAGQLLVALPAEPEGQTDWGLAYQRVQYMRRIGQNEEAWKILASLPRDADLLVSPDDWWAERRAAAYDAMKAGKAELAYELVRDSTGLSINPLKEQAFLAGWIALRLLGKAEMALAHLEASRTAADGPLSLARGEYWLGRALEALGRKAEAAQRYQAAAVIGDTFHGQLARHKLAGAGPIDIRVPLPALPSAEQARRFVALDSVRGAVVVFRAGLERGLKRGLFGHLRNHLESEAELAMLAHLAGALGDVQTSLRVGKTAIARGFNLVAYAYPLHAFPEYTPLREPPEPAMLLGVARQETEFNSTIVSSAGARGLLQVMPVTAQHICRDHKIKCEIPRLITDNTYNAQIASAYLGDRMAEFRGSYVLTLVGYNAGPGRARQWIRELGDPRDPAVDPIDWIERIPIEETREYVKKVLSNIQVYRARLDDPQALRLEDDLRRKGGERRARAGEAGER